MLSKSVILILELLTADKFLSVSTVTLITDFGKCHSLFSTKHYCRYVGSVSSPHLISLLFLLKKLQTNRRNVTRKGGFFLPEVLTKHFLYCYLLSSSYNLWTFEKSQLRHHARNLYRFEKYLVRGEQIHSYISCTVTWTCLVVPTFSSFLVHKITENIISPI